MTVAIFLQAAARTALGMLALCLVFAEPAGAYTGTYTAMELFPLQLGNTWKYQREAAGDFDKVDLTSHRVESVLGVPATVIQAHRDGVLREEWSVTTGIGLRLLRVKIFDAQIGPFLDDLTMTFGTAGNPGIRVTDESPTQDEVVASNGSVQFQHGTFTVSGTYSASSEVTEVGAFSATKGAFTAGLRTHTTLQMLGLPIVGSGTAEFFWGRNLGPTWMDIAAFGFNERTRLIDTNVDVEATDIVTAHSPTNRATIVGGTVTAFAAFINAGTVPATWCGFAPLPGEDGEQWEFSYAETDPLTNAVIGPLNPTVDIGPGVLKTFVFSIKPTAAFGFRRLQFVHDCWESPPTVRLRGVNDFGVFSSAGLTPDPLLVGRTVDNDNIVTLANPNGTTPFVIAGVNLGATAKVRVAGRPLDPATPVAVSVCRTNPTTGVCEQPPAADLQIDWTAGLNLTFGFFVQGLGADIPDRPDLHRVEAAAFDEQGNQIGGWNAAVRVRASF